MSGSRQGGVELGANNDGKAGMLGMRLNGKDEEEEWLGEAAIGLQKAEPAC